MKSMRKRSMNFLRLDGLNVRRRGIAFFGIKALGGVHSLGLLVYLT
jgi:hypothetical protein